MTSTSDADRRYAEAREAMVRLQLIPRGINDPRVLEAMASVPRHAFIPTKLRDRAYEDSALPINLNQTISQPYIVALMTQLLSPSPNDTVLEVGTGSGYQTAVLAKLAKQVYSIERHAKLADHAANVLEKLNIANVHAVTGDGSMGLPEFAPYNRIIVTAAAPEIPDALVMQLCDGGRLVCPVGSRDTQTLAVVTREKEGMKVDESIGCRFVPLIGEDAWPN